MCNAIYIIVEMRGFKIWKIPKFYDCTNLKHMRAVVKTSKLKNYRVNYNYTALVYTTLCKKYLNYR